MPAVPLPITKQRRLFCLFVCHGTLTCYGVGALSLPIPHDMHLVVPTHLYFFLAVCHPSRTFPPKELEQEPQNRFSPLSTARPCHLLPLTHDPLLLILAKYRLVIFGPCVCSTSVYVQNLPTVHALAVVWKLVCTFCHPSLISYGVSYFLISHSLWLAPFRGRTLLDCRLFFFHPTLLLLSAILLPFPTIPLCHFCCDVIRPKPAGPL